MNQPMQDRSLARRGQERRWLMRGALGAAVGSAGMLLAPRLALADFEGVRRPAKLALVNIHTKESLQVVYRDGPLYLTDALFRINQALRDHRTGDVHTIDPALLEQLSQLARLLGIGGDPFNVISGYRSPRTNAMLVRRSSGVARNSFHMSGRAIDIRLPGVSLARVREAALSMQAGGVGYYPKSGFIHLDTGPVRRWRG